jgi:dihydroxy-acid dehydratase
MASHGNLRSRNSFASSSKSILAIVRDGDTIVIDVDARKLDIEISEQTMAQRFAEWTCPEPRYTTGVFAKYVKLVSSASQGAVTG